MPIRTYVYLETSVFPALENVEAFKFSVETVGTDQLDQEVVAGITFLNADEQKFLKNTNSQYQILSVCLYNLRQGFRELIVSLNIDINQKEAVFKFDRSKKKPQKPSLDENAGDLLLINLRLSLMNEFQGRSLKKDHNQFYNIVKVIGWEPEQSICKSQVDRHVHGKIFGIWGGISIACAALLGLYGIYRLAVKKQ